MYVSGTTYDEEAIAEAGKVTREMFGSSPKLVGAMVRASTGGGGERVPESGDTLGELGARKLRPPEKLRGGGKRAAGRACCCSPFWSATGE